MILAIDPGPEQSAVVFWNGSRVVECAILDNRKVRECIGSYCDATHKPRVAIEMIASYGMAVGASVFNTCVQIGRMVEMADRCGVRAELVFRKDVKLHLCGTPRAKDANVAQALRDRIGEKGTKAKPGPLFGMRSHTWAALAVAVTAWDGAAGPAIVAGEGGSAKVAGGKSKADSNTHDKAWVLPGVSRVSVPSEHPPLEKDFVAKGARR
ncbi:MAG: hypothetical protein WCJ31_15185 [Planctomycetia bacterium]